MRQQTRGAGHVRTPNIETTFPHQTHFCCSYSYADGSKYEGCWSEDRRNGRCHVTVLRARVCVCLSGRLGRGVYKWISGDRYEGDWMNELMEVRTHTVLLLLPASPPSACCSSSHTNLDPPPPPLPLPPNVARHSPHSPPRAVECTLTDTAAAAKRKAALPCAGLQA